MKHILTLTLLFLASLCAAQVGEVDIDAPAVLTMPSKKQKEEANVAYPVFTTLISTSTDKTVILGKADFVEQPAPDTLTLTIEDVQDVICKDNEPLRALVRVWYMQALHTGRNDAQAVEIALDKLGKLLIEKLDKK